MAVHDRDAIVRLQDGLYLLGVVGPEVPVAVVLVERRVREDDERRRFRHVGQILLQPGALLVADLEAALHAVVQPGDGLHALHRRHPARGPEILLDDTVEHDEVRALVVERVDRLAEQRAPLLAHVEVPVVLADHHAYGGLEVLEDLRAEVELGRLPELCQIAAEENEIRLRIEAIDVVDGAQQLVYEAVVDLAVVEVRVRDVRDTELLRLLYRTVGDVDGHERMGMEQTLRRDRRGGGHGHFHERPALGRGELTEEVCALLVVASLDALEPRTTAHGFLLTAAAACRWPAARMEKPGARAWRGR